MKPLQLHERIKIARQHVKHFQRQVDALYPFAANGEHIEKFEAAVCARDYAVRNFASHFVNMGYLELLA